MPAANSPTASKRTCSRTAELGDRRGITTVSGVGAGARCGARAFSLIIVWIVRVVGAMGRVAAR